ncbi:MAG: zf-HC2 domain-containing protein [Methylomarinum sp.]|nr:zf-HC2 domain-containing protein [Methylomarinum sp.]
MLTCKEASYLASKKLDKELTLREQIGFSLHIAMCSLCRHYARDMNRLHTLMLKAGEAGQTLLSESAKLSEQSRERIKQVLDKALHSSE